jgi:hypothetical protein
MKIEVAVNENGRRFQSLNRREGDTHEKLSASLRFSVFDEWV